MNIEYRFQNPEREKKLKIWIVDDDEEIFRSTRRFLSILGNIEIEWISDGEKLLKRLNNNEFPDFILLDSDLGEGYKRGEEIIQDIREKLSRLGSVAKIIAYSSDENSNKIMLERGADIAFKKGLEIDKLKEYLESM